MADLSEYERQRLENIKQNQALLKQLNIKSVVGSTGRKAKTSSTPASTGSTKRKVEPPAPTRRSGRLSGVKADSEEWKRQREEEEAEVERIYREAKKARHEDQELLALSSTGNPLDEAETEALRGHLKTLAAFRAVKSEVDRAEREVRQVETKIESETSPSSRTRSAKRSNVSGGNSTPSPSPRKRGRPPSVKLEAPASDEEVPAPRKRGRPRSVRRESTPPGEDPEGSITRTSSKALEEAFSSMSLTHILKVVPERVYSLAVHPDPEKDLIFVGDKNGHLGIWDVGANDGASNETKKEDEDEEGQGNEDVDDEGLGKKYVIRSHGKKSISCIKLDPVNYDSVYTSSYDCTVRRLNFETGVSVEVADVAQADEYVGDDALCSAFELTHDGNEVWISDTRGGLSHRDMREAKASLRRWVISDKKAGCISLNPRNERIAVTAHLEREIKLWDLRKLSSTPPDSDLRTNVSISCFASYTHGKACTSAYFDPTGTKILSTSYDDSIRIWNVKPGELLEPRDSFEPKVSLWHNNQTGRYLTVFKAQWSPNTNAPPHFTVGNMKHSIDVFDADGSDVVRLHDPAQVTATPAVTASHPNILGRAYGATGSGKVMVWRQASSD